MPTADRYSRYRSDQTTVWISKTAADFIGRERTAPGEGTAAVLDRLIGELRKRRRASPGDAPAAAKTATKAAGKVAAKGASKTATKAAAKKTAAKGAGGATKRAAKRTA